MKVTSIDISDLRYDGRAARHEGHVSMELRSSRHGGPMNVHFVCHSAQTQDSPTTLVTYDLVNDALRQAHRMPGFRRGERRIEVEISDSVLAQRLSAI